MIVDDDRWLMIDGWLMINDEWMLINDIRWWFFASHLLSSFNWMILVADFLAGIFAISILILHLCALLSFSQWNLSPLCFYKYTLRWKRKTGAIRPVSNFNLRSRFVFLRAVCWVQHHDYSSRPLKWKLRTLRRDWSLANARGSIPFKQTNKTTNAM